MRGQAVAVYQGKPAKVARCLPGALTFSGDPHLIAHSKAPDGYRGRLLQLINDARSVADDKADPVD